MSTAKGSRGSASTPSHSPEPPKGTPAQDGAGASSGSHRRTLMVLLAILVGALMVIGVIASVRMEDNRSQSPTEDKSLLSIGPEYVTSVEGDMPVPNGTGEFAVDSIRARAWTTPWNEGLTTKPCETKKGRSPGIKLTFDPKVTLREFAIAPGLSASDPLRPREWQPKTVELWWKGADCTHVELPDSTDVVRFPAPAGELKGVVVRVVDAYPPSTPDDSDGQLSIGEISFWKR